MIQILRNVNFSKRVGGESGYFTLENGKVFVKKISLTDLELLPENFMSSSNIFDLLYYIIGGFLKKQLLKKKTSILGMILRNIASIRITLKPFANM